MLLVWLMGELGEGDQRRMREVKEEVVGLLSKAARCSSERIAGMAREILELKKALFTLRALRPAVLWCKGS